MIRESNTVQAAYQTAQGDQPVLILFVSLREPRGTRTLTRRVADGDPRPENRLTMVGAGRGNRTLIIGLEDRGPTVERCQRVLVEPTGVAPVTF